MTEPIELSARRTPGRPRQRARSKSVRSAEQAASQQEVAQDVTSTPEEREDERQAEAAPAAEAADLSAEAVATPDAADTPVAVQTVSLAEADWQEHLHDESYWQQRHDKAMRAIEQIGSRARKADIGLPVPQQMEIRENAVRALWQALVLEGRITGAEISARVTEVMLRYYKPAFDQLTRERDLAALTGDPRSVGMGGRGSALDAAIGRSRPEILRPNLRHVRFANPADEEAQKAQKAGHDEPS